MTISPLEAPMRTAWRLAHALGCNLIPTTIDRVPLVEHYAGLASPGAPRIDVPTLTRWRDAEAADLARGRETTAWALLPGSARVVVLGGDSAEWTARLLARQPTPLVVRSPTPGRAHLYYRWPEGVDISPKCNVAGADTYDMKARGATIHAPGSLHHRRQGRYVCELPVEEQVPGLRDRLPVLDLAAVQEDIRAASAGRPEYQRSDWDWDRWSEDGEGERRWAAYLRATPPATRGARQSTLYRIANKAGDLGLPEPVARPGLLAWAAECVPPLERDEVLGALARAYLNRKSAIGSDLAPDARGIIVDE